MKRIFFFLALSTVSLSAFSQAVIQCKDAQGNVLSGSVNELVQIMNSNSYRPEAYGIGVVTSILPDDTQGLPHQKYWIQVAGKINVEIVSNLDFGRTPVQIGQTVAVCGEYVNANTGAMIHWTHFDPHGGHPNGFTMTNGQIYGEQQTGITGESSFNR